MTDTSIKIAYGDECIQCSLHLHNDMEHLVGLCPHCFITDVLEKRKWFLDNCLTCLIPDDQRIRESLRLEAVRRSEYACQNCVSGCPESELRIDRIIPLCKGGNDDLQNFQVLCSKCIKERSNENWRVGH